jgi:hypothetical protein
MEKSTWKTIAIIFIVLFTLETLVWIWGITAYYQELEDTNVCYYDICSEYPDAWYEVDTKVCSCYDYGLLGDLEVVKQEYMK